MAEGLIVEIAGVGPVRFEPSRRAKRLNISVKPFKGVRVAVPCGMTLTVAEAFAHSKTDWIERQLLRMKMIEKEITGTSSQTKIDRDKAVHYLSSRLDELARQHGFSYNRVTFRSQRTRWGSCSVKNNISLNIRLFTLPLELIDYVLLHELVHLEIKNHSSSFWHELQRLMPDARARSARLKKIRIGIG